MRTLICMTLSILIIANMCLYPSLASEERFEDSYYVWRFDVDQSGTAHVEVEFHIFAIPFRMTTWELSYSRKWEDKMMNIEAHESTGEDIKVEMKEYSETIQYSYRFRPKSAGENIEFIVEYDLEDSLVEIVDGVSYFEFWWTSGENFMHILTDVYLPAGSEVLLVSELDPQEVSGRTIPMIHFEEKTKGMSVRNGFGVGFSSVGKASTEKGDKAYNAEQYEEARSYYEEALSFYGSISGFYGKGSDEYFGELSEDFGVLILPTYMGFSSVSAYTQGLEDLRNKIALCEERAEEKIREADTLFAEGKALFEEKKYEEALAVFQEAQELYRLQGESEKEELCQQYGDMCSGFVEEQKKREEADRLFGEGVTYSEQGNCEMAVGKFEEALSLYEELGDEEKVQECVDRIQSCEDQEGEESEGGGFCLGSTFVVLCAGVLILRKKEIPAGSPTGR
ncbi:MAG: tetratricopeptide repeat protein [Theionarchaea archaeon]|nr:tetratricopeptide repeat protein [Theionarchaea archaeon]MBU7020403.1 tetratricopeptide repeat protein [Theionarchaea archaeon]